MSRSGTKVQRYRGAPSVSSLTNDAIAVTSGGSACVNLCPSEEVIPGHPVLVVHLKDQFVMRVNFYLKQFVPDWI